MKLLILTMLFLSGCSVANYTRTEGATTVDVWGFEFGTDKALSGLTYESDKVKVGIESLNTAQTTALQAVIAGAVQGAALAVKP